MERNQGFRPEKENERARDEYRHAQGGEMHSEGDFFGNEGVVDEATGKPIDNVSIPPEKLSVVTPTGENGKNEDALGEIAEPDDEAARWLRENDPDARTS